MSDPTPPETGESTAPPTDEPAPPDRETYARPPSMLEVVLAMHPEARIFGLFEFWGTWWFWHWRNSCGFRWLCEAVIVATIFGGLFLELSAREQARAVDHAQLFAQIAALAKDVQFKDPKNLIDTERAIAEKAGAGIAPIMTLLAREDVSMWQLNVAGVRFPRFLNLRNANLRRANLSYAKLIGADLSDVDLRRADLREADLSSANLTFANLYRAFLRDADLSEANLRRANLALANLRDAKLRSAFLRSAFLPFADLSGADLSEANLTDANLSYAKLIGADLSDVDLRYADLRYADLIDVDLSDADLSDADLREADLSGVRNLTQEQLDKACIREGYESPNLDEAKDPETGKPLVWQGKICSE